MNRRPAFMFYPADWRKDSALQSCSIGARGLWIDLLCIMHECTPYGSLSINGQPLQAPQIARLVGETVRTIQPLLKELEDAGVCSRHADGAIFSRRMQKDEHNRNVRAEGGKLGGNPLLLNKKDKHKVNLTSNLIDNHTAKQEPTPSYSYSVSSSKELLTESLEVLKSIPGYPFNLETDSSFLEKKAKDFPAIDVLSLLKGWEAYLIDNPFTKKSNPRSQLYRQFELAVKYRRHQRNNGSNPEGPENSVLEKIKRAQKESEEASLCT